ncbi:MAG TPA: glycosyltransferase family 2 protein [Anaerolineae bacterium]|nr:glycosyltransferase family 2 protein [Anaerolineae bacterium]
MRTFSIVVPVFYNESNLPTTIPQLLALADRLPGYRLELVFVDDGSGDCSLEILMDFRTRHPDTIKVVKLTRNFGSMAAILAGISVAEGDCVGMIAADLQDPPELFVDMVAHWEKGIKAILAVRQGRDEPFLQRLLSNGYYTLMRAFAISDYPAGGFDFFVVDRQIAAELMRIGEKNTNIMSLIFWLGFQPLLIPYTRQRRQKGRSRWTLAKKLKLFVDTFVAFSFVPIRLFSVAGFLVAVASFLYGAYVLLYWWFFGIAVKGFAPTMVAITFASGLQMAMLGVLGEYLWRVLDEVRRRPQFVIDEIFAPPELPRPAARGHESEAQ